MAAAIQSLHWADTLARDILQWQKEQPKGTALHVDDMKTPSGRVHTGSLRGVVLHDAVAKVLQENTSQPVISTYVFNDMDPMDGLPAYLDPQEYQQHMGKPLYRIPAPPLHYSGIDPAAMTADETARFQSAGSMAEFYAADFIHAFRTLGCEQEIVWSHELYESGKMDEVIRLSLDNVKEIKQVYKTVADYELPEKWYPFQVICPKCGKIGTTLTTDWDGEQVAFECQPKKVEWAEGCGYSGKISPFGGTGKLLWKVDWPAHWRVMGVTVEGAGKDHSSAGGSRDMGRAIIEQIFGRPNPFDIPYEFILIRGAKMSSSKGVGTSAREFVRLFPAQIGRYLFLSKHYSQVIDFDPEGMAMPDLFDEYDQAARIFWGQEEGDRRFARAFELAQPDGKTPQPHFLPRFRDIALWMQHPELDLQTQFEDIKGSKLTAAEKQLLTERQQYAQIWVDRYAPAEFQLTFRPEPVPPVTLSPEEIQYLQAVETLAESKLWQPEDLQQALFDLAKQSLGAKQGFQALYRAFLGRTSGPRAAWLLQSIPADQRRERLRRLQSGVSQTTKYRYTKWQDDRLRITPAVSEVFPSITVGSAVITGVKIQESDPRLEEEKQALLRQLEGMTVKQLGELPEIQSYRQLFRATGVDWHSRRPSPEALLRRVVQGKGVYTINTCVDAYNLAVMKHRVSVGAFDCDAMQFPARLDLAKGGEMITLHGKDEPVVLQQGEICYFDQEGPYNLDFNYRDAVRTSVRMDTKNLFINLEGVYDISRSQVEEALGEVIELITRYCGGTVEAIGILEAQKV